MYGFEKSSEDKTYFFYWASIFLVFLIIFKAPQSKGSSPLLACIVFSLIYMIPTIFFIITLVNIKATTLDYNFKNFKKCKSKILLMFLGVVLAVYISILNIWNLFFAIPIILTSIELVLARYIEICSGKNFITLDWYNRKNFNFKNGHIILKNKISSEELEIYKNLKWKNIFIEFMESFLLSIWLTGFLASTILYFFNLITPKIISIIFIYFFLKRSFIWYIIDCKFNLFLKMTGICTDFSPRSRGLGGSYTITDFKNKKIILIRVDREIYKKCDNITVVYGALSNVPIKFYKF